MISTELLHMIFLIARRSQESHISLKVPRDRGTSSSHRLRSLQDPQIIPEAERAFRTKRAR